MKVGNTLKDVYLSTKEFIKQKDPKLAEKIHKNFGFGIGCEIKETMLEISATNETKIEAGMVFHTRITFNDGEIQVAIGDSVHVLNDELEQLTENVPREYARISFTLEEDDEEEEEKEGRNSTLPDSSTTNHLSNKRTRAGRVTAASDKLEKEINIKKDQSKLLDKMLDNLVQRFTNDEI